MRFVKKLLHSGELLIVALLRQSPRMAIILQLPPEPNQVDLWLNSLAVQQKGDHIATFILEILQLLESGENFNWDHSAKGICRAYMLQADGGFSREVDIRLSPCQLGERQKIRGSPDPVGPMADNSEVFPSQC